MGNTNWIWWIIKKKEINIYMWTSHEKFKYYRHYVIFSVTYYNNIYLIFRYPRIPGTNSSWLYCISWCWDYYYNYSILLFNVIFSIDKCNMIFASINFSDLVCTDFLWGIAVPGLGILILSNLEKTSLFSFCVFLLKK